MISLFCFRSTWCRRRGNWDRRNLPRAGSWTLTRWTIVGEEVALPRPPDEIERFGSFLIEAAVQGVLITSIYLPNGNPQPGPKFNYKLAWFERLIAHAAKLMASGAPVVLAGDYNVVPTPQDIYRRRRRVLFRLAARARGLLLGGVILGEFPRDPVRAAGIRQPGRSPHERSFKEGYRGSFAELSGYGKPRSPSDPFVFWR